MKTQAQRRDLGVRTPLAMECERGSHISPAYVIQGQTQCASGISGCDCGTTECAARISQFVTRTGAVR